MSLSAPVLRSTTYDLADAFDVNELYQQRGWTDGLPIVPPTAERVLACLQAANLAPGDIVGVELVRQRPMTAEKVAINAVMATSPRRLASLAGRTVGLLDNGKMRVHELLDHMEEMLRSQQGVAQVLRFKKPDASRPAPPEVMADLKRCEVVISAVGD